MAKETHNQQELQEAQRITKPLRQRLLTIPHAAEYLDRGTDSLREMIYRGIFPVIQQGDRGKIWLDVEDLNVWIEKEKRYMGQPADDR